MAEIADVKEFQGRIAYTFHDEALLARALTHSSYANERREEGAVDYERLEFLGDAVLEVVASEFLYARFPDLREGELTKKRAAMVCEAALAHCARKLEVGKYLRLGRGEEGSGGREREAIIADVMEAVAGAIYLDGGFDAARTFVTAYILESQEELRLFFDSKTLLQEIVQKQKLGPIAYSVADARGPEHRRIFTCEVQIGGKKMGTGEGTSKKIAEQNAAREALLKLEADV